MAEEKDFNDIVDDILLSEEKQHKESYDQGFKAASEAGNTEGFHLGYHRGAELGRELESMLSTITKLQHHISSITKFVTPLLPIANCHMVEFLTKNHWENLLPADLRNYLDKLDLQTALDKFWSIASGQKENSPLSDWVHTARSHCVKVNSDYCITGEQLQQYIEQWGGDVKPEVRITQFMTSKKSYEVQTMSRLVASLHSACGATCCVEAGGGRGHLPLALSLAYNVPSLTIDCDAKTISNAEKRIAIIQKQWHAIAKLIDGTDRHNVINKHLHRFATAYITKDTDFARVVKDKFPEFQNAQVKVLLTGLHTCGNLGPDSLRIFASQPSTASVFNVPCCYHLLTEEVDGGLFDVFQRDYGSGEKHQGFPISEYLRGYTIGRNARMLAAQSIDRVVNEKQLPSISLLWRALLQVIVTQKLPNANVLEGKMKRMATKCENFEQYFKMADKILNLELFDRIDDGFLTDVCKDLDCQWKKMVLFYLMRLCLAQVVESLILLDRLLFLFENGMDKVYLVKLFDPVLSPRCHSIVAVR